MAQRPETANGSDFQYAGGELELFETARNWKRYFAARMRPFVRGDVAEVGAGLGANVPYLHRDDLTRWLAIEPDSRLSAEFLSRRNAGLIPQRCELVQGTLRTHAPAETFDTILYIDVLEHIEDDRAELACAFGRLRPGGHLIILCPAHDFLYSPFDASIGHVRRYDKRIFRALSDRRPARLEYLDSVGMLASLANKLLLRQSYPNAGQIRLWDGVMVPISRVVDTLTLRLMGKSILGVWRA